MSIQSVAWVLEESPTKGLERLALISIANHDNKDQPWATLTYTTIAHEAGIDRRTAVRVVRRLRDAGYIEVRASRGRRSNEYRIVMDDGEWAASTGAESHRYEDDDEDPTVTATVSDHASNGDTADTRTVEPLEPPPLPRPAGGRSGPTNPRALGVNPRALGTNPRRRRRAPDPLERDAAARRAIARRHEAPVCSACRDLGLVELADGSGVVPCACRDAPATALSVVHGPP